MIAGVFFSRRYNLKMDLASSTSGKVIPATSINSNNSGASIAAIVIMFIVFIINLLIIYYVFSAAVAHGTYKALAHAQSSGIKLA